MHLDQHCTCEFTQDLAHDTHALTLHSTRHRRGYSKVIIVIYIRSHRSTYAKVNASEGERGGGDGGMRPQCYIISSSVEASWPLGNPRIAERYWGSTTVVLNIVLLSTYDWKYPAGLFNAWVGSCTVLSRVHTIVYTRKRQHSNQY